ncbi:hypothetical protein QYE76_060012 [Lolium multiflorum]|uniref:CCHC-type domain-containing protein n=1 Tax=Lolium multiflorum TaxID=4521 RepID=A0AAD8S1D8_LOLMU|nr:hypothetical protein QYE76_060012 [Lolium multiflorum]
MTWREYEVLRNEMRREFRVQDEELKETIDGVSNKLDTTNETVNAMQYQMTDIQRNIQAVTLAVENLTQQQQHREDEDAELQDEAPGVGRGVGRGNRGRGFVELGRHGRGFEEEDGLDDNVAFLHGLKYDIKGIVRHHHYTTMNELLHHAREAEAQLAEEAQIKGRATGAGRYTPRAPPSTAPAPSSRSAPYSTPSSKPVSNVSNTEPAASTSGSSMSTVRNRDMNCHTCGGKGQLKRDCPNRKVMIINEDNEYETGDDVDPYAPEDDDCDSDGVDAYPSEARTIIVSHRALNVLPSASTQRCSLFETKALVGPDKACKVIIDGGSCRNLASKELCTNLKLKYLPHPHPYYIQWLCDNGEMKVNYMVCVEFDIGPYKDSIDFDVVPMTEFSDVFPEEVPAGLPPLRGIEHQIDLIPGASLPNRAPYRMNPEETKEIHKQVQALLEKGYIRISLSPCVVPVILVPKKDVIVAHLRCATELRDLYHLARALPRLFTSPLPSLPLSSPLPSLPLPLRAGSAAAAFLRGRLDPPPPPSSVVAWILHGRRRRPAAFLREGHMPPRSSHPRHLQHKLPLRRGGAAVAVRWRSRRLLLLLLHPCRHLQPRPPPLSSVLSLPSPPLPLNSSSAAPMACVCKLW